MRKDIFSGRPAVPPAPVPERIEVSAERASVLRAQMHREAQARRKPAPEPVAFATRCHGYNPAFGGGVAWGNARG